MTIGAAASAFPTTASIDKIRILPMSAYMFITIETSDSSCTKRIGVNFRGFFNELRRLLADEHIACAVKYQATLLAANEHHVFSQRPYRGAERSHVRTIGSPATTIMLDRTLTTTADRRSKTTVIVSTLCS
jgi:hypothetical protein